MELASKAAKEAAKISKIAKGKSMLRLCKKSIYICFRNKTESVSLIRLRTRKYLGLVTFGLVISLGTLDSHG